MNSCLSIFIFFFLWIWILVRTSNFYIYPNWFGYENRFEQMIFTPLSLLCLITTIHLKIVDFWVGHDPQFKKKEIKCHSNPNFLSSFSSFIASPVYKKRKVNCRCVSMKSYYQKTKYGILLVLVMQEILYIHTIVLLLWDLDPLIVTIYIYI